MSLAHRDGAVLHTLMSAVVERDADGRSVRRLAVCEDISETVRRQAELVRSEPGSTVFRLVLVQGDPDAAHAPSPPAAP